MYNAPKLEDIADRFLNVTRKYGVKETYAAITDYGNQFRDIKYKIRELTNREKAQSVGPQNNDALNGLQDNGGVRYGSLNEMLKIVYDFYASISVAHGEAISKVLKNPGISISFNKGPGYSSGYTTLTSDNKLQMKLDITPTPEGLVTLAQELANACELTKSLDNKTEKESQADNLKYKATNKTIACLITKFLSDKYNLPKHEETKIQFKALRDLEGDFNSLEVDRVLFDYLFKEYPEAFETNLEHFSAENFVEAMNKLFDSLPPSAREHIYRRIEEIALTGKTARYIQGEATEYLSQLYLNQKCPQEEDKITRKMREGITSHEIYTRLTGESDSNLVASGKNLVSNEMADIIEVASQHQRQQEEINENVRYLKPNNN